MFKAVGVNTELFVGALSKLYYATKQALFLVMDLRIFRATTRRVLDSKTSRVTEEKGEVLYRRRYRYTCTASHGQHSPNEHVRQLGKRCLRAHKGTLHANKIGEILNG